MKNEVTKIMYMGRAEAEPLERAKAEAEREAMRRQGEEAIREVREALLHNLPTMPEQHREAIKSIFGLNN